MELGNYIKPLLRWWWLLLVSTLLAVVSSYLVMSRQPPTYQATATLMIGPAFDDPNPSGSDLNLSRELARTYADMARRRPVREQTMSALGMNWLPEYQARPLPNSQLLEIVVVDNEPERAQAVANELANQLILQSPTALRSEDEEREAFIQSQLASLQANIEQTEEEIAARQGELEGAFSARRISELENEIAGLQNKLSDLRATYTGLLGNTRGGAVNTVRLFEPATLPSRATNPGKLRLIAVAGAVALSLAAGTAYLLEYLDDTVRSAEDLKRVRAIGDITVLPSIPIFEPEEGPVPTLGNPEPNSRAANAFRALHSAIVTKNMGRHHRTILITSCGPQEGKSVIAANLAAVIAQSERSVLLVDADFRRPVQHKLLNVPNDFGFADLLQLPAAEYNNGSPNIIRDTFWSTLEPNLQVLTAGSVQLAVYHRLSSEVTEKSIAALKGAVDSVIMDSPPLLAVADALMLSRYVDDVILVASVGSISSERLAEGLRQLRDVNANVIGVVLNRQKQNADGYYYYDYYTSGGAVKEKTQQE